MMSIKKIIFFNRLLNY